MHQNCYGIGEVPEHEWLCFNCRVFGQSAGKRVKCGICPRVGGAMRPTNVLSSDNFLKS